MYVWMMLKSISCFKQLGIDIISSIADTNEYQVGKLENDMIVVLVRDPSLTKTSFCIGVQAGFRDDPISHAGVAHLNKHLMDKSGKLNNAVADGLSAGKSFPPLTTYMFHTASHSTTYMLDALNKNIEGVADIMTLTLTAPPPAQADISLEIAAVDTSLD